MSSSEDDQTPFLIPGGRHDDARGSVAFVNGFDFSGVERFYWIQAGQANAPRGWVGHQRDHKWFSVICGEVLIAVVRPDQWQSPRRDLPVLRYTLSAANPQVLHVPSGYATGSFHLNPDAILMVFSSGKIAAAKSDDFRFPVDYWTILPNEAVPQTRRDVDCGWRSGCW
jgi:dTDP-4-dehydrorhamnose 3,5-epimerase-like enzyme